MNRLRDWVLVCLLCWLPTHTLPAVDGEREFKLTWTGYNGMPEETAMDAAAYSLNGVFVGKGGEGLSAIKGMGFDKKCKLRVVIPDSCNLGGVKRYAPPYQGSTLIPTLLVKGVRIVYEYKQLPCDVRVFWCDAEPSELLHGNSEATEMFLDWESLGMGWKAVEKLKTLNWGSNPCLQIMMFGGASYPFRTHDVGMGGPFPYPGSEIETFLIKHGVRVETYSASIDKTK